MLHIWVSNSAQQTEFEHERGPLEFGRAEGDSPRLVLEDRYVSRDQLRIEQATADELHLENLGSPLTLSDGTVLQKGQSHTVSLPVRVTMGYTELEISLPQVQRDESLQTIARPIRGREKDSRGASSLASLGETPSPATLASWFETLLSVQRAAAGSIEFYGETAQAVVDLVGLDRGLVLLREENQWKVMASNTRSDELSSDYSRSVLNQVLAQQRTFYQTPEDSGRAASLMMVETVVASPIFDPLGDVVGVVYGSRDLRSAAGRQGIQPLEAQVIQLLAGAVSAGLARMEREREATRIRLQFEQFVSPVLARELHRNPKLLEAQEREVTVLFSDIRGFSRIAEQLGPEATYRLAGDILTRLTNRILEHGGVIVDYYGDGLEAMWNAPTDQPDQVAMACRAALDMQAELPELNDHWKAELGVPVRFGIGINTGVAMVGNAGSQRRLKYGPRGNTVNLASRVEGATKQWGVPILISEHTKQRIADPFVVRRLGNVRAVGMDQPVELFQLHGDNAEPEWLLRRDQYERALALFERRELGSADKAIQQLLQDPAMAADRPALLLAEKTAAAINCPEDFDPVFQLDSK